MTTTLVYIADWLLTWFVHASLACGAALFVCRWLVADRSRDRVWKAALVLPLLTSILSTGLLPPTGGSVDVPAIVRRFAPRSVQATQISVRMTAAAQPAVMTVRDETSRVLRYAILAMILVPGVIASERMIARRRRNRARFQGRRAVSARNLGIDLDSLSPRSRSQPVRLSMSSAVESAAAIGPCEICVSHTLAALGHREMEAVIAHELAHVERRDFMWGIVADAISCLLAAQPLVGVVTRRLRRDAEFICDDVAVSRIGDARAYVETLIRFATPYDSAAGVPAYGSSPLVERAERLLLSRAPLGQSQAWEGSLVIGLLLVGLLALPRLRTADANVSVRAEASSATVSGAVVKQKQIHVTLGER